MQVQLVDGDGGIVVQSVDNHLSLGIEGYLRIALQPDVTLAFVQRYVGTVAGAVGRQPATDANTVGNAVGAAHLGVEEGCHEVQVLGLSAYLEVGFHPTDVRDVLCGSVERDFHGSGEGHIKPCQFQMLHVAIDGAPDVQRVVGEMFHELLGQMTCIAQQILLP